MGKQKGVIKEINKINDLSRMRNGNGFRWQNRRAGLGFHAFETKKRAVFMVVVVVVAAKKKKDYHSQLFISPPLKKHSAHTHTKLKGKKRKEEKYLSYYHYYALKHLTILLSYFLITK